MNWCWNTAWRKRGIVPPAAMPRGQDRFPSHKPPPWLFLRPGITFLEKKHQLAHRGLQAGDESWKEQPKLFQQLKIIGSAEASALADITARSPVFVTDKESPRGIGNVHAFLSLQLQEPCRDEPL
jgi:hypothetical protein